MRCSRDKGASGSCSVSDVSFVETSLQFVEGALFVRLFYLFLVGARLLNSESLLILSHIMAVRDPVLMMLRMSLLTELLMMSHHLK